MRRALLVPALLSQGPATTKRVACPDVADCRRWLAPVPDTTACAAVSGGPAEATVKGSLDGRRVDASFSLANGCEVSRWRTAAPLLGPIPG